MEYECSFGESSIDLTGNGELESIFCQCDEENTGLVPVSRLLEHLKEKIMTGNSDEVRKISLTKLVF
jgi:Ca2+-binding EF-hand superfamily protein